MQHRSRRGVATGLAAFAVFLIAAGNAFADTKRISDGNDRPGRLDIRSAAHGHDGDGLVHTISTFGRWPVGLLGPGTPNLFAVEISTDADRALERVVLVFSARGRMVARVYSVNRRRLSFVGSARASKPNARTMRVVIPRARIGDPAGYRWNAHSQFQASGACSQVCVDKAPNSGRVAHDVTAPTIALTSFPPIPADVEYDVSFRVQDAGGAGLRRWLLQHRPFGTAAWTTVASGISTGLKSHHHVAVEDDDDEFRVVAVDRHGNTRVSAIRLVSVPIDDAAQPPLVYTGSWSHGMVNPLDFRGTVSTSSTATDTVTLSFTGRHVAWIAPGGGDGEAVVSTDDGGGGTVELDFFAGSRQVVFQHTFAAVGPHQLTITVQSGTVPVDGIVVR